MNKGYTLLIALMMTACSSFPVAIAPSTSPLPPNTRGSIPAYGSNCQYLLLGLIPISGSLNTQDALDEAKRSAQSDVLTDVTVEHGYAYYLLFSTHCVRVEGKGVPRNKG